MSKYAIRVLCASVPAILMLGGCPLFWHPEGGGGGGGSASSEGGAAPGTCDPSVCPDVGECYSKGCEINGGCVAVPLPKYTGCSVGLCDGDGACVAGMCVLSSRCPDPPTPSCASKYCGADERCHLFNYETGTGCDSNGGSCDGAGNCVDPLPSH